MANVGQHPPAALPVRFFTLCLLAFGVGSSPVAAESLTQHPHCGTARLFEAAPSTRAPAAPAGSARIAEKEASDSAILWGRVLQTPHFVLHYTLGKNVHQPTWTSRDAGLKATRDSLHNAFAALAPASQDSAVNAVLDSLGAPHPFFIQRAAAYFENAYAYYADTLGMRMPDSNIARFYRNSAPGKYNVEIGDIDSLMGGADGLYGLTFPRHTTNGHLYAAQLLIDNDFLYNATVNRSTGAIQGTPIQAYSKGRLLHSYDTDWDAALAVTIAHEFYHVVQFTYTPTARGNYHSWYELSAVGMEERLADTVNDYLGYLPAILNTFQPISIFDSGDVYNANYANGIFHVFLTRAFGKAFDVAVWERLRTNGNKLSDALLFAVGGQSPSRMDSLYSAYAASLAIAGIPGSDASPLAFSHDFPAWTRPLRDSARTTPRSISLPPLSYCLVKPLASVSTWATFTGISGASLVAQRGAAFSSTHVQDSALPLLSNGTLALVVANGSLSSTGALTLSKGSVTTAPLTAFPNPATRAADGIHFTAVTAGSMAPVVILSESGRYVATVTVNSTGSLWNWNFRDAQNRTLSAGIYYYGRTGDTPQTLLVLP